MFKESRVIELDFTDELLPHVFAIQLRDGSMYGQEWIENENTLYPSKTYPTWKNRQEAESILLNLPIEIRGPREVSRRLR